MRLDPEGVELHTLHDLCELADARVLEIGCGDGRLIRQYASTASAVFGIDTEYSLVADAMQGQSGTTSSTAHFAVSAAEVLPYVDKSLDGAFFAWSL